MFLRSLRVAASPATRYCARRASLNAWRIPRTVKPAHFYTSTSSKAALASEIPAQPTIVLDTPSPEYLKEEELDVDLIPPEQVKLVITDRAAEVSRDSKPPNQRFPS